MNIHWLQHVPFEGLGCIEPWLLENGHTISCTRLWADEKLPSLGLPSEALAKEGNVDGLIVMGGPMGIYDDEQYPWLAAEKAFIKEIIEQDKPVFGICFGAQLIADVLEAEVRSAKNMEIGFFPIIGNSESDFSKPWKNQTVFHWHGDTFDIPDGAVHLASSEACKNQAFVYNDNVLALQFHLETTEESLLALYENCSDEIGEGPFIQSLPALHSSQSDEGEEMQENFPASLACASKRLATLGNCNALMFDLLGELFGNE